MLIWHVIGIIAVVTVVAFYINHLETIIEGLETPTPTPEPKLELTAPADRVSASTPTPESEATTPYMTPAPPEAVVDLERTTRADSERATSAFDNRFQLVLAHEENIVPCK